MNKRAKDDICRKFKILSYAKEMHNVSKMCRHFGISRESFYQWKRAYEVLVDPGLINNKPCPENPKPITAKAIEDKIFYLRQTYHLEKQSIVWYLARYHDIKISETGVYFVLKCNGLSRLPSYA